jgi:REP element-mobilizing transposase RayT
MSDKFQNQYRIPSARASWWDYSQDGLYFITLCTANREPILGKIENKQMALSTTGEIVKEEWEKSFAIRRELFCDIYVIMPNHIHAILRIDNNKTNDGDDTIDCIDTNNGNVGNDGNDTNVGNNANDNDNDNANAGNNAMVETHGRASLHRASLHGRTVQHGRAIQPSQQQQSQQQSSNEQPSNSSFIQSPTINHGVAERVPKSISSFVAGFKSSATKQINEYRQTPKIAVWQTRFHDHIIRDEESYHRIWHYIKNNPAKWNEDSLFKE